MKLWCIVQWGNKKEGGNGKDTQCIVRSNTMMQAITLAEQHMSHLDYKGGKADVACLLGNDDSTNPEDKLVIQAWLGPFMNFMNYPCWHLDVEHNVWIDAETMFGLSND